ncbi:MAG: metallophosphoesterase [Candidatus Gottesmanbacteria bacterium]
MNKRKKRISFILFGCCALLIGFGIYFLKKNNTQEISTDHVYIVAVLPDTQNYSEKYASIFEKQTQWIVENAKKYNIVFVSHLGDIVQNGASSPHEWDVASRAMSVLEQSNIPYGIIPGNHDIDVINDETSSYSAYNKVFFVDRYNTKKWFGGNFLGYQNNYQHIQIGFQNVIILNLEPDPTDEVLYWANSILSTHKDTHVIITIHIYLQDDGTRNANPYFRPQGNSGDNIWNKLIYKNCNIFLVLSGHYFQQGGQNRLTSVNGCGKPVYQIVQDYQSREKGGNGWLRLFAFYPLKHLMRVYTFSSELNTFNRDSNSQFELPLPF